MRADAMLLMHLRRAWGANVAHCPARSVRECVFGPAGLHPGGRPRLLANVAEDARDFSAARPCACHADPPVLHGPYWQWTRKVAGKTVTRLVPDEQLDDYRQWLDNHRRLRALVAELEALTLAIADAGSRSRRAPQPRRTGQTTPITLWLRPC